MRFEIHCHSDVSDGRHTPLQMLEKARKIGLDGMVLTDHDEISGSLSLLEHATEDFRVYPGIEVSAKEGHILALNVKEIIPKGLSGKETVERIHSLGGIAIAAHPYDRYRRGVGDLIHNADFDAVEVVNGHTFGNRKDPVKEARDAGLSMTGGTDAHTTSELGGVTIEVHDDLIKDILKGKLEIHSKNTGLLFLNHWVGIGRRRFQKHIASKIRK